MSSASSIAPVQAPNSPFIRRVRVSIIEGLLE
jgi:hypothetical protein